MLIEFRAVATRPLAVNGLGLAAAATELKSAAYESQFAMLDDTPAVYPAWKGIVAALGVVGKQVHDARLVAVCHVHQVGRILLFNAGHFGRLTAAVPGLNVIDPRLE